LAATAHRICLVNPPSGFLLDERVFVSLGLLKVASALEAAGHEVRMLDLSGISNFLDPLHDYLDRSEDFAFGITTTTPQLPAAAAIAEVIRARRPASRLILGGPHVTLNYAGLKLERRKGIALGRAGRAAAELERRFDVLCAGDGELAVLRALEPDPPKILDGDEPKGGLFLSDEQFSNSPFPARHLVDMRSYHYAIEGHDATSIIAQLGCPFGCGFCGGRSSKSLRLIRTRSIDSILEEVELLHREYGYTGFMFYDDELNVNRGMVELMNRLADLQERLGSEFRLRGFVKAELFTEQQAVAMRRAGFRWLLCGFEAADPRILVNIRKRAGLDDNTRCVEIARRNGLKVKALMSVGHPGEDEGSIRRVRDWLVQTGVDDFDCTVITTYPGTPYYDEAVPHERLPDVYTYTQPDTGDRLHAVDVDYLHTADYYKGDPEGGYRAFVFTDALSSEQLVALRDELERDVRARLSIPFNPSRASLRYEHSMGQGLPDFILRRGETPPSARARQTGSHAAASPALRG
jgi:radical SAM superfamily enzyme YgiQ (UPF0313 family)